MNQYLFLKEHWELGTLKSDKMMCYLNIYVIFVLFVVLNYNRIYNIKNKLFHLKNQTDFKIFETYLFIKKTHIIRYYLNFILYIFFIKYKCLTVIRI